MYHCGADVHSKSTTLTILNGKGKEVLCEKIDTTRLALQAVVKPYRKRGIVVIQESGALQAFIHQVFEEIRVKVITVPAHRMKVITASKRKSDKRDSFHLADRSFKKDLPEAVYVPNKYEHELRTLITAQQRIRKGRTQCINGMRGQLKSLGIVLPEGSLTRFTGWEKLLERDLPEAMKLVVEISYDIWSVHTEKLEQIEAEIKNRLKNDDLASRMLTIPYVGLACAAAARGYLGDLNRFHGRKSVGCYGGFIPSQRNSGEKVRGGRITKEGPTRLRAVFIQAAHLLISSGFRRHASWKKWFERLLHRKSHRNIAVVAVAKRLYLLAYHVGKGGDVYKTPEPTMSMA